MGLGNTLQILRPPERSTPAIQTVWNDELIKNMHDVLSRMSQQITAVTISRAGVATIDDAETTQAVAFTTDYLDTNYSVALATDGTDLVWVTAKAVTGFTLNRAGSTNARVVDWTTTRHVNP